MPTAALQIFAVALVTWLLARVRWFPGIRVARFRESVLLAVLLAVVYAVLNYVAAPLNWVTLGMFGVVVGAVAIELADFFVPGVELDGFWWALGLAVVVALTNFGVEVLVSALSGAA